jgi:hypothetical protein
VNNEAIVVETKDIQEFPEWPRDAAEMRQPAWILTVVAVAVSTVIQIDTLILKT